MNNPYSEVLQQIKESTLGLVAYHACINKQRARYERFKLLLLVLLILNLWIMFFLIWCKLDDLGALPVFLPHHLNQDFPEGWERRV